MSVIKQVWGDVSDYEEYPHKVVKKFTHEKYTFEIRSYAPRVAACTKAPNPFMILAGYIGVGSAPKNQGASSSKEAEAVAMTTPVVMSNPATAPTSVAMTTPVVIRQESHQESTTSGNTRTIKNCHEEMAFMLPGKYTSVEECPVPDDDRVYLKQVPAVYKACHRYSPSFLRGDTYGEEAEKLRQGAEKEGLTMKGSIERHGFNPPFTLVNKRADVCVDIEWAEEN